MLCTPLIKAFIFFYCRISCYYHLLHNLQIYRYQISRYGTISYSTESYSLFLLKLSKSKIMRYLVTLKNDIDVDAKKLIYIAISFDIYVKLNKFHENRALNF